MLFETMIEEGWKERIFEWLVPDISWHVAINFKLHE